MSNRCRATLRVDSLQDPDDLQYSPPVQMMNVVKNWFASESSTWQDGVFYALCAAYSVVAVFALVMLYVT